MLFSWSYIRRGSFEAELSAYVLDSLGLVCSG